MIPFMPCLPKESKLQGKKVNHQNEGVKPEKGKLGFRKQEIQLKSEALQGSGCAAGAGNTHSDGSRSGGSGSDVSIKRKVTENIMWVLFLIY